MLYFAYGSNLSSKRLQSRVPSAVKVGTAVLFGHQLRFHKKGSLDGSAKCDAYETGNPNDQVIGVLYKIDKSEQADLDKAEGLGVGYESKLVRIQTEDGAVQKAFTYYATTIDCGLKPFDWYHQHVLCGALENQLPSKYIQRIREIRPVSDPDHSRSESETSIYNQ